MELSIENTPTNVKFLAACRRIQPLFPSNPEGNLYFAVLERAIRDALGQTGLTAAAHEREVRRAKAYLQKDMEGAEILGIDSSWIRDTLTRLGIDIY